MIWDCTTVKGISLMCKIDDNMNAECYMHILDNEFIPTLDYYKLDHDNIIFQQDNDPKHTSCIATEWFRNNSIKVLVWPA